MVKDFDKLVAAVVTVESAGNPSAVSHCGAKGLMQLMDATGREWHDKLGLDEPYRPFDPDQNRRIGTAYLGWLIDRMPTLELAIAAYNAGPGRVSKAIARADTTKFEDVKRHLPKETRDYVLQVLKQYNREIV